MSIEQIKRCFISHQVATAMCLRAQQKTKTKRIHHNVEMIIYDWIFFLLNCLLIDFSGIFHHLTFASSTRKTDIHHTSIYSQFEMHSWYIITQWPRCSTTNKKKPSKWCKWRKKIESLEAVSGHFIADLCIPMSQDQSVKIYL